MAQCHSILLSEVCKVPLIVSVYAALIVFRRLKEFPLFHVGSYRCFNRGTNKIERKITIIKWINLLCKYR